MRNPEGGAAPYMPQFMYKVPLRAHVFFFFRKGGEKGGECGPEPDNLEDAVA